MNKQITRLAVAAVAMLGALIVATTYWQTWAQAGLADRQDNAIQRVAEFTIDRGTIGGRDGRPVYAKNFKRTIKGKEFYFREYPARGLAPHIVGYSTQVRSRAGLERSLNDYLTGSNTNLGNFLSSLPDRLAGVTIEGNDVRLTLDARAQRVAQNALGNRCGAIVALEPATGRVLVMVSSPTYDPNLIERNFGRAQQAPNADCRPGNPLLNRATQGLYAPGSTFKVVTASAALESGKWNLESTFDDPGYCEEYGKRVENYDTSRPYGRVNFLQSMQYSINSVFCNIGKELGSDTIVEEAQKYGFYARPPLETPINERSASGLYEDGELFVPKEAQDADPGRLAFGQERLLVTPLQMAMVAATVANGGLLMRPAVVERIVGPNGKTVAKLKPEDLGRAIKETTARDLTEMMKAVVTGGTATAAAVPGISVAGKTGTAETGRAGVNTVSFIGFAPADDPQVAIAVIVEAQQSTGGETAAPIAKEVLQAILRAG